MSSDSVSLDSPARPIPVTREPRPPAWLRRLLRIVLAWSAAWWLVFGALIAPALPGHWATVLLAATLLVIVPLIFLTRALSGVYPSATVRLFAFRPFWYSQLAVPLMVMAGVVAFLAGAPFGAARAPGQTASFVVLGIVVVGAVAGYLG